MKEEIKMKQGGFIVNGRPYQFFSRERVILNCLFKGNSITRRGVFGILFNLLTKVVEGQEQQKGTAEVLGEKKVVVITTSWLKYVPKRPKK